MLMMVTTMTITMMRRRMAALATLNVMIMMVGMVGARLAARFFTISSKFMDEPF
jgi:hypothetical protein